MEELFEQFVQEKVYLNNVANRTVGFYGQSRTAFKKHKGQLSKDGLNQFSITMGTTPFLESLHKPSLEKAG